MRATLTLALVLVAVGSLLPARLPAQQAPPIPHHTEPYQLSSGLMAADETEEQATFAQIVQVSGAPWLRIHFADYNLGQDSFLTLTSLEDNATQHFTSATLPLYGNSSATFNGDAVEIVLHVAPGEDNIFYRIEEVTVGEHPQVVAPEEICGTVDDRVSTNDDAVGRIVYDHGCTGWIASNGVCLSAGHCRGTNQLLQFNVPASDPDGTINFPGPEDQYPIVWIDSATDGSGVGDDWAVFRCEANSETGLTPIQAQDKFYRMWKDQATSSGSYTIRITGYGVDGPAPDYGDGPRNADSRTLQTDAGPYRGEEFQGSSDCIQRYVVDTENAGSGSPIIIDGTSNTIGIHTNGGCSASGGANKGTGFENNSLESVIDNFPGSNVVYADTYHPNSIEDGTVMRPFDTVADAVSTASSGAVISIVKGTYSKASGNTFTVGEDGKALTFEAPVGTVTIGN